MTPDGRAEISQPSLRVLLAMLASEPNRVVSSSLLIEALWDTEPTHARLRNLHAQVYQLRRRLTELEPGRGRPRLQTAPPGYLIELEAAELDVTLFGTLARRGKDASRAGDPVTAGRLLRQALDLWRGQALADVAEACQRLTAEAAALDERRLATCEDLAAADLAAGRPGEVTALLGPLADANPLRERLCGLLMVALYRSGHQAAALEAYQRARHALAEELGIDPNPELQDRYHQILRADPRLAAAGSGNQGSLVIDSLVVDSVVNAGQSGADSSSSSTDNSTVASPPDRRAVPRRADPRRADPRRSGPRRSGPRQVVPRQLPAPVAHFAGRDLELRALDNLLDDSEQVIITTIGGTAGVGKSALAVHWAHRAADRFPDGQLHLNLRGYDPGNDPVSPDEAILSFLDALGVPPSKAPAGLGARAALYRTLVAGRRMLILLDNVRDASQVRPLLPGSPGCLVLVTSRSALSGLAAAEDARPVPLGLLDDDQAAQLLSARLGASRVQAEAEAARELVDLCARLPLALAITAARAASQPALPLSALAAELANEHDRLDALDTGDPSTSIRGVFSWSYQQLSDSAARLFRLLAVHPGPDISRPAAASLAGVPLAQARQAMAELARANLVSERSPGRFALHDLLRSYAAEQAAADGPDANRQALARCLDHYLGTACHAALLLRRIGRPITLAAAQDAVITEQLAGPAAAVRWFEAEHQVLLACTNLAAALGFDAHAWQLPWALRNFLYGAGHWQDWAAMNAVALASADRLGDEGGLGWTRYRMGQLSFFSGNYEAAIEQHDAALAHFARAGDLSGQGLAHIGIDIALTALGRYDEALAHGERALLLFRDADDPTGQAHAEHQVGSLQARVGNAAQGRDSCLNAVTLYAELGDPSGQAEALCSLGAAHRLCGEQQQAIACYQLALDLWRQVGHRIGRADALIGLGDSLAADGDTAAARQAWQEGLEVLDDMPHPDKQRVRDTLTSVAVYPAHHEHTDRTPSVARLAAHPRA